MKKATRKWMSLADLAAEFTSTKPDNTKQHLRCKPRYRKYLSQSDCVYDYMVGHEVVITDNVSGYQGSIVSILDADFLKQSGYTSLFIEYNNDQSVEVAL